MTATSCISIITQAVSLQLLHPLISDQLPSIGNPKRLRTGQRMKPNPTVAVNDVARRIRPHQLHPFLSHRLLQPIHTRLRIIRQQWHIIRRRLFVPLLLLLLCSAAERGGRVSGVQPGGENRAALVSPELVGGAETG
uniref:Uncharacterized protein n=1 Tax=Opuntia streptacantha TaxID=393608 RepID=A0A7C8ZX62_OPUST